jgi:hypothetical protein
LHALERAARSRAPYVAKKPGMLTAAVALRKARMSQSAPLAGGHRAPP